MHVAIAPSIQDIVKYTSIPLPYQTINHEDLNPNCQVLSTVVTVILANIECPTASKASMQPEMYKKERAMSMYVSPRDSQNTTSSKVEYNWNPTYS